MRRLKSPFRTGKCRKRNLGKTQIGEFVTVSGEDNTISQDSVILNETTRGKAELDSVATVSVLYKPAGYVTSALSTQKVMGTLTVTVNEA